MAVTLTAADLCGALRADKSAAEMREIQRLLTYTTAAVTRHAPDAPDAVHNEAAIRVAGYLYDGPAAGRASAYANPLRNSGAAAMLAPYRGHRAGVTG